VSTNYLVVAPQPSLAYFVALIRVILDVQVSGIQLVRRLHSNDVPHDVCLADRGTGGSALSLRLPQRHR